MENLRDPTAMETLAARIRIETLGAMAAFGGGHVGGCMSIADALAALYGGVMRFDRARPDWPDRDRLVLSKGHCGPALYAALALAGFFPLEWLKTLNQPGTRLPSHCDRLKTPGIDVSTGSLGQGASLACGLALAGQMRGKDYMVYAILGDGELQEGQVWEAFQFASETASSWTGPRRTSPPWSPCRTSSAPSAWRCGRWTATARRRSAVRWGTCGAARAAPPTPWCSTPERAGDTPRRSARRSATTWR